MSTVPSPAEQRFEKITAEGRRRYQRCMPGWGVRRSHDKLRVFVTFEEKSDARFWVSFNYENPHDFEVFHTEEGE